MQIQDTNPRIVIVNHTQDPGVAFFLPEFSDILALPGPECAFSAPINPSKSQGIMAGENVDERGGHADGHNRSAVVQRRAKARW